MIEKETIVAIATPPGLGAIGIIRLSGDDSLKICNGIFQGRDLTEQATHTIHFGAIHREGSILDEVLVSVFNEPKSYTGENTVEISCHGSPYIQQEIVNLLIEKGARLAKPGEFTMRAFFNAKLDLSQAEAVADLIVSKNAAAHQIAMNQMRGGYSNEISNLRQQLIHFASLIELELDFSEEDVEFADRKKLSSLVNKINKVLAGLIQSFKLGNVLKNGVTTVIAGKPNAGKSTLLNALLNEERAIVSEIPGTTRDAIEEVVNIDGIQFRFVDTAGIRDAKDKLESMGIEKTMEQLRRSAIFIYLFAINEFSTAQLQDEIDRVTIPDVHCLVVANKIDLAKPNVLKRFSVPGLIKISSLKGENIDQLKAALHSTVMKNKSLSSNTIVSCARHYEALTNAQTSVKDVVEGLEQNIASELIALDIKRALQSLGEVTGEVTTDDLLGNIFSKFCIGK